MLKQVAFVLLLMFSASAGAQIKPANKNEQLVSDWFNAYLHMDAVTIQRIFSSDFKSYRNGKEEKETGPELQLKRMREHSPAGRNVEILDLISGKDKVVARIRISGKNARFGNKEYDALGTVVFQIAGGKIIREWQAVDDLDVLQDLGFSLRPPGTTAKPIWKLLYQHDADGKALAGDIVELLNHVRAGAPIRYAYRVGKEHEIEHVFPAEHITINKGHVHAQMARMASQRWDNPNLVVWFGEKPFHYYELVGTDGNIDGMAIDTETAKVIHHQQRKAEISWFAQVSE
jgi:hypothetical protein